MPLPTSIDDLSTVPGDNFPQGTDSPDVLDNVIREHAAYIAELRDNQDSAVRTDPSRTAARIEWDYSNEVHRDKPFVQMLGTALGLTSQQLDNLFIQAAQL